MATPTAPFDTLPRRRFAKSPKTWRAIMMTASPHPQRRRRDHPIAADASATASNENTKPMAGPNGDSCAEATGLRHHARSRKVPGRIRVVAASEAIAAPKNRNMATAGNPRGEFCGRSCRMLVPVRLAVYAGRQPVCYPWRSICHPTEGELLAAPFPVSDRRADESYLQAKTPDESKLRV